MIFVLANGGLGAPAAGNQLPPLMGNANTNPGNMLTQNHLGVGNQDLTVQPKTCKDWHAQVTQDLRNHLVHKL